MIQLAGFPRGLLSLLQSQNFGENPRLLADVVAPCIDTLDLYAVNQQVMITGTSAAPGNGFNSLVNGLGPVPTGEVWRVMQVSAFATTGGAASMDGFAPCIRQNGAILYLSDPLGIAINLTLWRPGALTAPLYLPGGAEIGIYCQNVTGAPTVAVSVIAARLRA